MYLTYEYYIIKIVADSRSSSEFIVIQRQNKTKSYGGVAIADHRP